MTPDVVVDVGNTRLKWGVCEGHCVTEVRRLSLDDPAVWEAELETLPPRTAVRQWTLASVNPPALAQFRDWLQSRGRVAVFENATELPIRVNVDEPAKVGIDRLFGAIAAKSMVPRGTPAITVDIGTAATVNLIDGEGVFQGGAILPGPRMMGRALREHTARLPLVDLGEVPVIGFPGKNTADAIRAGIAAAIQGGVALLLERLGGLRPRLFLTGGARGSLSKYPFQNVEEVIELPTLVLEGIRIASEALP